MGVTEAALDLRHLVEIVAAVHVIIELAAARRAAVKSFASGEPRCGFGT